MYSLYFKIKSLKVIDKASDPPGNIQSSKNSSEYKEGLLEGFKDYEADCDLFPGFLCGGKRLLQAGI